MRSPALVAALVATTACAPIRPPQKVKPFPYDGFAATYPTGMRLVAYGLPHMPDVMVSASYRAGSVDDPPGKEGLAHLVEHLTFRARPGGGASLWNRVLAAGVEFNGITSADSTDYYAIGQPEQLEQLLRVEADRLREPLAGVDEATFAREREVVVRELRERALEGADQVDWLRARALPASPYARAGTVETVGRLTLEDAREFVRRHYRPADVILVVTGPEEVKAAARRTLAVLGALATGDGTTKIAPTPWTPPRHDLAAPVPAEPEVRPGPVERPTLWLAWTVPGDADRGAARTIAAAEHVQGRLAWIRRELGGRVVSARSGTVRMDGASLITGRVTLRRAEDARAVLDALRAERRARVGLGDDDLAGKRGVRDALLMQAHLSLEALEVTEIARHLRTTGEPDYVAGWQKTIAFSLSSDSTQEFVSRYLGDGRVASLLVVPAASAGGADALPGGAQADARDHHGPARAEDELVPARPPLRRVTLGAAERRRLPNGLEVVVAPREGFRALDARLVFKAEPRGPAGQMLELLATLSSSCGLADWAEDAALRREPGALVQSEHLPSDLLEDALADLSCRARRTTFDAPFFERLRRAVAKELDERPELAAERDALNEAVLTRLFPGAFETAIDGARVRAYGTSDAKRFHASTFRPEHATLILSGDVRPTPELWKQIERRFGDWRVEGAPPAPSPAPLPAPARRQVLVLDRPGARSAEITVGLRVPPRGARDEPAFRILTDHLLHGALEDLRTRRSLTYSVVGASWETPRGAALLLRTTVDAARTTDATTTLLAGLAATATPLSQPELERARIRAYRQHLLRLGTSARDGRRLAESFVNDLPATEWDTFGARLLDATPAEVQASAGALAAGTEVVVIAGDAASLRPALAAAGLAPEVLPAPPKPR